MIKEEEIVVEYNINKCKSRLFVSDETNTDEIKTEILKLVHQCDFDTEVSYIENTNIEIEKIEK